MTPTIETWSGRGRLSIDSCSVQGKPSQLIEYLVCSCFLITPPGSHHNRNQMDKGVITSKSTVNPETRNPYGRALVKGRGEKAGQDNSGEACFIKLHLSPHPHTATPSTPTPHAYLPRSVSLHCICRAEMRQWSLSRPMLLSKTERMGYTIEDVPFGYLNARVRWTGGEGGLGTGW